MTVHLLARVGLLAGATVLLTGDVTSSSAQSLADVARREAERRQQVPSGKVYTDGDLAPVDAATPPPQPVEPQSPSSAARPDTSPATDEASPGNNPGKTPVVAKAREKRDEQYWRGLMRDLKGRIGKANAEMTAQEARLAEIDAGEQNPIRLRERQVVTESLARAQRDARSLTEELTRFMTRAQMAKVPDEWLR